MKTIKIHGARSSHPIRIEVTPSDFPSDDEIAEDTTKLLSLFHSNLPNRTYEQLRSEMSKDIIEELKNLLVCIKGERDWAEDCAIESEDERYWWGKFDSLAEVSYQIKSIIKKYD